LLVRYARLTAPASIMSLYASLAFVVLGPLVALFLSTEHPPQDMLGSQALQALWSWPNPEDLLLLTLTGITSAFGFMCSSKAYQHEEASRVAPFEYIMIIWVSLLSYLVWSEIPDPFTVAGIAIIIGSGIYVLQRENVREAKPIAYTGLSRR
ncbi:MAG: EamA family transporter, partial [Pseudomonadota bacterium]